LLQQQLHQPNDYFINEGGYGHLRALGAKDIHSFIPPADTLILAAVGTGTMAAGLLMAAEPNQTIIAIPVLKGADALSSQQDIAALVNGSDKMIQMIWKKEYHFGGYAKHPAALI
jgi:1-aminocyclopropane-1-carboxylate deaminase